MNSAISRAVRVDLHNADTEGYLRLNSAGTVEDIQRLQIVLFDGADLLVTDGEVSMTGKVRAPGPESVWRLEVDWEEVFDKHGKRSD